MTTYDLLSIIINVSWDQGGLIITTVEEQYSFQRLLGDGTELGMTFKYVAQPSPDGLAQAFILGEDFIDKDDVCLVLGDNIFYGHDLTVLLTRATNRASKEKSHCVWVSCK